MLHSCQKVQTKPACMLAELDDPRARVSMCPCGGLVGCELVRIRDKGSKTEVALPFCSASLVVSRKCRGRTASQVTFGGVQQLHPACQRPLDKMVGPKGYANEALHTNVNFRCSRPAWCSLHLCRAGLQLPASLAGRQREPTCVSLLTLTCRTAKVQ